MYQDHEIFEKPSDLNSKVWRYMDFTKFVALLLEKSLFFTRADKFDDPFEGAWSERNIQVREEHPELFPNPPLDIIRKLQRITYKSFRKFTLINCWHMNEYESAAMWKLYLKTNEGIAIQSTFKRLTECFDNDPSILIHVGKVKYIDYSKDFIPETNLFFQFLHKRKSFEHEREVRAIFSHFPGKNGVIDITAEPFEIGKNVPINLETLIESIYINPTSPIWFSDLVNKTIKKLDMSFEIHKSKLYEAPIY